MSFRDAVVVISLELLANNGINQTIWPRLLAFGPQGWEVERSPLADMGGGLSPLAIARGNNFLSRGCFCGVRAALFPAKWPEQTPWGVGTGPVPASGASFIFVGKKVISRNLSA
jgi:hypothetical protein